ncbi:MAG: type II toxin-antitoxin system PemK/MazF family toxin [Oscillospiraceae bacterium]|nr:type II toxin-antitoxin system PemK/MazF family toxin [Oscillospiraceae bacterium]
MNIFDIYIAYIEYENSGKARPVLILESNNNTVSVFSVTTQYKSKSKQIRLKYFKINDWRQAGLVKQSYVDTNVVRDISKSAFGGKSEIGKLTDSDARRFVEFLSNF